MSYLRFEKALMTNLQESLPRELLRTNRSGAYACSTLVDCNTRKYHGLLVVPVPELDDENHVLLSSLDCTVVQHGAEFNLGLHKYGGNHFAPNGHKYIRSVDLDSVPTTTYRVGGVVLKREQIFQHYEDRMLIRYTLEDASEDTILRFRPFLAFRSVREFTHENNNINRDFQEVPGGIKCCLYPGYPELFMQFNKPESFIYCPDWYRGIEYPKEQERGYAANEDLFVPGYFELSLKKGESVVFAASTSEADVTGFDELFQQEVGVRKHRDNFFNCLITAAHQFHVVDKEGGHYVVAGYPWFKARARDTFIALPGLTLSIEEDNYFEAAMETAEKGLREFMSGKPLSVKLYEIEQPDVMLWAVWALQQYDKEKGREACSKRYGDLILDILRFIVAGKHHGLTLDGQGLLRISGRDKPATWMNSVNQDGRPVVPRSGYVVEINALWYNALLFAADIADSKKQNELAAKLRGQADRTQQAFQETFVNQYGYLFDYVDGGQQDWSVRPNQIFAAAFDYSPLTRDQKKSVIDICTRELLTPKGLRSLSPKSGGYNPMYVGPQTQRDQAYHQGTAWPWLVGFYMEASIKLYKRTRLSFLERQMVGYEDEMFNHCVGTIPELFDGNPPYHGRGAVSYAVNVAEILRALEQMEQYKY